MSTYYAEHFACIATFNSYTSSINRYNQGHHFTPVDSIPEAYRDQQITQVDKIHKRCRLDAHSETLQHTQAETITAVLYPCFFD